MRLDKRRAKVVLVLIDLFHRRKALFPVGPHHLDIRHDLGVVRRKRIAVVGGAQTGSQPHPQKRFVKLVVISAGDYESIRGYNVNEVFELIGDVLWTTVLLDLEAGEAIDVERTLVDFVMRQRPKR